MENQIIRFNARIPYDLHQQMKQKANSRGLTMNAVLILALETYFTQQSVLPYLPELIQAMDKIEKE